MWMRHVVKKNERALLMNEGDFVKVLEPGVFKAFDPFKRLSVQTARLDAPLADAALADYLRHDAPDVLAQHFVAMDLADDEAGLRYEDDVLVEILTPGTRRLYWRGLTAHRLERVDLMQDSMLPAALVKRIAQPALRARGVAGLTGVLLAQVPAYHVGVLKIDGKIERLLDAGVAAFWRFNRDVAVELVDLRLQAIEVGGQEILTRDKVALRLNLSATWCYADVLHAFGQLQKPVEHLYRELQFALRSAVGTRSLDELLEDKQSIDDVVIAQVRARLGHSGVDVRSVGVKDIVLPGDMKTILAQVVEAEKSAQANVIRRREETAATRSLLNTAKVMEGNPTALRLKELETLERVAERIDRISVFGGLDQVLNGLVRIKGA
ncbi:SPFH domain / Band 7 family protein [Burkholderia contaminans FFH2055]|uniref:slipin family protein n=1 Tax=Burkholderia contaminans TaxID=488447 RepID=UPI000626088F|nr:slipin family protein [Burkholderia contaminans]KKL31703.1 SPFH domain / Band 7 family protein [Burkholderia contaminans FFH2055]MEB4629231.1 slipin family protein [Burkholderia contaminans]MEB4635413.1 slipin family protein [Burkholderia contaminans]MEB4651365.1 slipin family protein [Burkholderia contaminans]MEB4661744.1 slipin family protein [Burkholderia contaminans]